MFHKYFVLIFIFTSNFNSFSQSENEPNKIHNQTTSEIRGLILDAENKAPLPYANIIVKHENRGVISNEKGDFLLNTSTLKETDSIWFQYIGYVSKKLTLQELLLNSTVILSQDIFEMNEVLILKHVDDPKKIIKKVIQNKDLNYNTKTQKSQTFIRSRYATDISKFNIDFEKSNIEGLDKEMIKKFEESVPKHSTSYSDFFGNIYINKPEDNELEVKIDPIKMVALKEKDIAELNHIEKLFDSLLKNTGEKEYWKIKSGVFGEKLEIDEEIDKDTIEKDTQKLEYFNRSVKYKLSFTTFDNKKRWDFLYKTGDYNYSVEGLVHVNGEDAYVIDFQPNKSANYEGRLYISASTYALIRADFKYAPNKIGKDIHLLGVGFSEIESAGSIYFEKVNDLYELKYFSTKYTTEVSLNRKFSLQKKQSKFLFDKNLKEIKARFIMKAKNEATVEYMVVENQQIFKKNYNDFEEKERMKVIYVDQFDENLWKDYPIIEPTKQMKAYKKLN